MAETTRERTERVIGELRGLAEDLAAEGRERTAGVEAEAEASVSRYHDATAELAAARKRIEAMQTERESLPNRAYRAGLDDEFALEDELKERYRNLKPALEALRERVAGLEAEIAGLVGPNPALPGGTVYDAQITAYTRVREAYAEAVAPLNRIERDAGRILRETTGHLGSGERAWGQIVKGVRDQRFGDPEVREHRLRKQAQRAAGSKS